MIYDLPFPYVWNRREFFPSALHRGTVVAFKTRAVLPRTGIIVMADKDMMMVAVNMYKETGGIWVYDSLPDNIDLYEANENETLWGYRYFLEQEYEGNPVYKDQNSYIAFVQHESPQSDSGRCWEEAFCKDFLLKVPKLLDRSQWENFKQQLWLTILKSGGLQFNRYHTEYYCYLIGVLMIAESTSEPFIRRELLEQFRKEWRQLSWMYGMAIGRVMGCALTNFTAVVKQVGHGNRKHYLHLYLPLVENNLDKICKVAGNNRFKLQEAINEMRKQEALEEQKTDLDVLYQILFPKHFQQALSSSRPAVTIEELKQEVAAKNKKIVELESRLSSSVADFNIKYESLLHDFEALANASVTFEEIEKGLLNLSRSMAEDVLSRLSITLAKNQHFMDEYPNLPEKVRNNEQPTFQINAQPGSTVNAGCELKNPEFKVLPNANDQQPIALE